MLHSSLKSLNKNRELFYLSKIVENYALIFLRLNKVYLAKSNHKKSMFGSAKKKIIVNFVSFV